MADASYVQTSFLGGQWSSWMQGRMDDKRYPTAMSVCLNGYPVEEGSWTRRQGTMHLGYTARGVFGRVLDFDFTETDPYMIELTPYFLRLWNGQERVCTPDATPVVSISTDNPAVVTLAAPVPWASNTQVIFDFQSSTTPADAALLRQRVFTLDPINSTQFTLYDGITEQPINGAQISFNPSRVSITALRILEFATHYAQSDLQLIRPAQTEGFMVLLHGSYRPEVLTAQPLGSNSPQFRPFSFAYADFVDGPYLDPVDQAQATNSGTSGIVTITIQYQPYSSTQVYNQGDVVTYNLADWQSLQAGNLGNTPVQGGNYWTQVGAGSAIGPNGFQSGDVGRAMRFLVQPAPWESTTNYAVGNNVTYNNVAYTCITSNTGQEPDQSPTYWQVNTSIYYWTWGTITSVITPNEVQVQILGQPFLTTGQTIYTWQAGVYADSTGWPTCGVYQGGRLWLAGAVPNRVDASQANDFFNMAPTLPDGTVTDACAIELELESASTDPIYWLHNVGHGIVAETKSGEWLIQASAMNDPITPTTADARKMTKYGGANILPIQAGLSTIFVQKFGKSCMEYLADVFTGRYIAPNLSETARDIGSKGFAELAYQVEATPIVWARMDDGSLSGMSFRRISSFATEKPAFSGWHVHILGTGYPVVSITTSGNVDGTMDALNMVTGPDGSGYYHIERLTDLFEPGAPLTSAWFLDCATTPTGSEIVTQNGVSGMVFYGLWYLNGKSVAVWAGGLDCGNYAVENGQVFVPFGSDPGQLFTASYMAGISGNSYPYGVPSQQTVTPIPAPKSLSPLTIQGYYSSFGSVYGPQLSVSWDTETLYNFTTGEINAFNLVTGQLIANVEFGGSVGGPEIPPISLNGSLFYSIDLSNSSRIVKANATTLAIEEVVGVSSSNASWQQSNGGNVPPAFPTPSQLVGIFATGNFLVAIGDPNRGIGIINADTMQYSGYYYNISEQLGLMAAGSQNANSGVVYTLGTWNTTPPSSTHLYVTTIQNGAQNYLNQPSWSSTQIYGPGDVVVYNGMQYTALYNGANVNTNKEPDTNIGTYWQLTQNSYINTVQLAAITPQDVFPDWTAFELDIGPSWLLYDASDGNIITNFKSAIWDTDWITKISTATGRVMWTVPFAHGLLADISPDSRCLNGSVAFYTSGRSGPQTVYILNTATGTYESYSISGVVGMDDWSVISDDQTGSLYLTVAEYTPGTGAPSPINGTPNGYSGLITQLNPGNILAPAETSTSNYTVPVVIGYPYTSQGQVLPVANPEFAGTRNGPAFAKTQRTHMFGMMVENSVTGSVTVGTDFTNVYPADYTYDDGSAYSTLTPFTGIWWDTMNDSYSFRSRPCWQISRPYPLTISAIGGFLHTQDR